MKPNLPLSRKPGSLPATAGELILQNGRQSGTSRPLGVPLTFIGRAPGCDIRLNVDGVDPLHCLLVNGPEGLSVRDLDSSQGTFVNGQRASHVSLEHGDMLNVGPFQFRLHLPATCAQEAESAAKDPVRLQSAAVAAQQVALTEEEAKLAQRRAALEKQEEQLAAHLEEKRQRLLQLSERAQAERAALERDRLAYERDIEKVAGDMTVGQRELLDNQKKMEGERKRLAELQRRIRQRWHRFWLAERRKFDLQEETLAVETRALEEAAGRLEGREQALTAKRLRFHTLYELGRCRLREAWQRLRQDQFRWKHRRGKERAALKVRERDSDNAEHQLLEAQRLFIKEKRNWDSSRAVLQTEVEGTEARVRNQRQKILEQQNEITRLDAEILARRQRLADLPEPAAGPQPGAQATGMSQEDAAVTRATPPHAPPQESVPAGTQETWQQRFQDLERLGGELSDQRVQLVECWHRLGNLHGHWEKDRRQASQELEELARRLMEKGHQLAEREQAGLQADQVIRQRHEELVHTRQQMIAWRARLRVRDKAWEGERNRLLTEVHNREELADQHLNTLVDLRQRWAKRRRNELEKLREERHALEALRKEYAQQRLVGVEQNTALEADKRILVEKALALEQYRKEFLSKVESPGAERRLERLRRRWVTLNATAIRACARERESLTAMLLSLEGRHAELQKRSDAIAQSEVDLIEKQTAWEHKQALAASRQTRIQNELQSAEAQRNLSEQELARMKEEIERIARALIDEPDSPSAQAFNQAA